jgi:hypothetical protein
MFLKSAVKLFTMDTSSNASSVDLVPIAQRTFKGFGKLLIEIRLKIWGYTCWHERNLDIWMAKINPYELVADELAVDELDACDLNLREVDLLGEVDLHRDRPLFKYVTTTPPPPILHICHESRIEGLKHYALAFHGSFRVGESEADGINVSRPAHIYVNFEMDRIFPMPLFIMNALTDIARCPIERIAFCRWDVIGRREYAQSFGTISSSKRSCCTENQPLP